MPVNLAASQQLAISTPVTGSTVDFCTIDGSDLNLDLVLGGTGSGIVTLSIATVVGGSDTRNTIKGFCKTGLSDGSLVPFPTTAGTSVVSIVWPGTSLDTTTSYAVHLKNVGERLRVTFTVTGTLSQIKLYGTLIT